MTISLWESLEKVPVNAKYAKNIGYLLPSGRNLLFRSEHYVLYLLLTVFLAKSTCFRLRYRHYGRNHLPDLLSKTNRQLRLDFTGDWRDSGVSEWWCFLETNQFMELSSRV